MAIHVTSLASQTFQYEGRCKEDGIAFRMFQEVSTIDKALL